MSEHHDLDRLRAGFAQLDDPPYPDRCPAPAEIWDGVHGRLPADRLRDVVEHLVSCPSCGEAWRLALVLEQPAAAERSAEEMPAANAASVPAARRPRRQLYAALTAVAAALFGLVIAVQDGRRGEAPLVLAERGGAADQARVVRWLTPDAAVLPKTAARLRWSGMAGATYDLTVELEDESGMAKPIPIAAAHGLAATEYTVPAAALAGMPAGAALHATLTAHLVDGRSETISREVRLR